MTESFPICILSDLVWCGNSGVENRRNPTEGLMSDVHSNDLSWLWIL